MIAQSVAFLLKEHGSDLTLTRAGAPTYDPSTGTVSNGAGATFTIRGVFVSYKTEDIDGSVVQAGDRALLVSAAGSQTAPVKGDVVDGMQIKDVQNFAPNGVTAAWKCRARR